jgi:hypothetical protein
MNLRKWPLSHSKSSVYHPASLCLHWRVGQATAVNLGEHGEDTVDIIEWRLTLGLGTNME